MKIFIIVTIFLTHSAFGATSGLLKVTNKNRNLLTPECKTEVLNPNLGNDIHLVECEGKSHLPLEMNHKWQLALINDPQSSDQWALGAQNIFKWWEQGHVGSEDVKIAIIDSGVNIGHEDFDSPLFIHGWNAIENNSSLEDPFNHGNSIAGIIGAKSNNGIGMAGLNWNVKIIPIKFFGTSSGGTTAIAIKAIDHAVASGAKIINLSWGGYTDSPLLKEIMERCEKLGILFVAASGNENNDNDQKPFYPANFDLNNIISVGAINFQKKLSYFSNFGKNSVDVLAPGESILTTISTTRYGFQQGTSFAAPQISGVAALIWARYPEWSYKDVKQFIMENCKQTEELEEKAGCGGYFSF